MGQVIPDEILSALGRGATVLTRTQYAARSLRHAYDLHMQAAGAGVWAPPAVIALDTWMPGLWHQMLIEGKQTRLLLNRVQEHSVWRSVIAAVGELPGLRTADSLAQMAAEAWHLLCLYNGRAHLREFGVSTDTRAFQRWAAEFERACVRGGYLPAAQLAAALEESLAEGNLPVPGAGLMLVDFDFLPPAQAQLLESIGRAGYAVETFTTAATVQSAGQCEAFDEAGELQAAAHWVRDQLPQTPGARIAVVVPDLAGRGAALARVFADTLTPEQQAITAVPRPPAFEILLGRPLAETALAAAALDLLRWPLEALPLESVSALMLSPFFGGHGGQKEVQAAAEFDAFYLRSHRRLRPEVSLESMAPLLRSAGHDGKAGRDGRLDGLQARLRAIQRTAAEQQMIPAQSGSAGPQQTHAGWADAFRAVLGAAGWSAPAAAGPDAYQARERWDSALDELATLDFDGSRLTAAAALGHLTRIVAGTNVTPAPRQAPVQIMSPMELGGVAFDALWFVGADDLAWPSPPAPHPLLPWHVQRTLGMPGADPARDTLTAQALTARIARAAGSVVFSYAIHTADGERRPSPLLRDLALATMPVPESGLRREARPLERVADDEPLALAPDRVVRGGATVLKLQAACGFRAFAERRLFSTEPDTRELGLDARDRGSLVHMVMEEFWARVKTQQALRALSDDERDAMLDACIDIALMRPQKQATSPWDTAYLDVQRKRLRELLNPWLEFEAVRPEFEVLEHEREERIQLGPLTLSLRVDRIDRTAGGPLIIDYKTGSATPSQWDSDRPDEPQLPLYAVLASSVAGSEDDSAFNPEAVGGVAFALLRAGDGLRFTGFGRTPDVLEKSSKIPAGSLPEQVQRWREVLTSLATAFVHGDAHVGPKQYPKTCEYCAQRIVCRLDPASLEEAADLDEDEGAGSQSAQESARG